MTLENWLNDIPNQFIGKRNIEILFDAFAKQMDELYQVFDDLKEKTTLQNAVGQNLKYIGDIVSLSMKEAQEILMRANDEEINDETYRKVLMYKALQNNCDCTYYDIMESIKLLWEESDIKYIEDPKHPATIYISLPTADIDDDDPSIGRVLAIRPGGVAMIYLLTYATVVNISGNEKASLPRIIVTTSGGKKDNVITVPEILVQGNIENDEKVTASIKYDATWYLDGTYMLDGTKLLRSGIVEEDL